MNYATNKVIYIGYISTLFVFSVVTLTLFSFI